MSRVQEVARMALEFGGVVTAEWVAEKTGIGKSRASALCSSWLQCPLYDVDAEKVNGRWHYVMKGVKEFNVDRRDLEFIKSDVIKMRDTGMSVSALSRHFEVSYGKMYKFLERKGISTEHNKHSGQPKPTGDAVEQYRTNKDNELWNIAHGRKING